MTNEEMIALALAAGAAARFRPNNWAQKRPDVEAYMALVERLTNVGGVDARMMEVAPASEQRRALLAEQLRSSGAAENRSVLHMSRRLLEKVREHAPQSFTAVFVDEDTVGKDLLGIGDYLEVRPDAARQYA